ncbi:hypothetical protein [Falsiroseomonas sp. CW058]|uniref:hypothetical protein n=1 Tax=Falsiroseomonas sp. CW058 TaxID=3388664 RepID=UPI003D3112E4
MLAVVFLALARNGDGAAVVGKGDAGALEGVTELRLGRWPAGERREVGAVVWSFEGLYAAEGDARRLGQAGLRPAQKGTGGAELRSADPLRFGLDVRHGDMHLKCNSPVCPWAKPKTAFPDNMTGVFAMGFMACVPVSGTRPEREMIRSILRVTGSEPLVQVAGLPGTPDAVMSDARIACFAMGCFWHHHEGCGLARIPQSSFDWQGKLGRNRRRDAANRADLLGLGYRVLWMWECAVRGAGALSRAELDAEVARFVMSGDPFAEIEGQEVRRRRATGVV